MNKRLQGVIAGVLVGGLLTSGVAFAKQISENAELIYNNIKIFVDGAEIIPKDANGNTVEPFIYNGTTYLPARAISNALGQEVEWVGDTQSVYIGKKDQTVPDNYLHKIQHNDYKEASSHFKFAVINGTVTDYNQKTYNNGLLFYQDGTWEIKDDTEKANVILSYPLNSQYKKLKGHIVLPEKYNIATWGEDSKCRTSETDVWFYGDNKLLYKATNVTSSMPFDLDIDLAGVNQLTIKLKSEKSSYIALTDLALFK